MSKDLVLPHVKRLENKIVRMLLILLDSYESLLALISENKERIDNINMRQTIDIHKRCQIV